MKRACLFLVGILMGFSVQSQTKETDSLEVELRKATADTVRLKLLGDIHWAFIFSDVARSKEYARRELLLAEKVGHERFIAQGYNDLGSCYIQLGMPDSALYVLNRSLEIRRKLNDRNLLASSFSKIAMVQHALGNYREVLKLDFEALKIYEELKNSANEARILNNISGAYQRLNDPGKALEYLDRAIFILEKNNDIATLPSDYYNKGNYLLELKQATKAKEFFLKALSSSKKIKDRRTESYSYLALGLLEKEEGHLSVALDYFRKAYELSLREDDLQDVIHNRQQLVGMLIELKKYGEAERLAIANSAQIGPDLKPRLLENYKQLAMIYALMGKGELSKQYLERFSVLKDSIYSSANAEEIANAEKKYETEKKEKENRLLQQQNAIKTLEIENGNKKIKIRNQTIFILIAGILVVLVIVFWQISLARIKKQRRELETEKKLQQDRERISRDLHDSVGGQLSYVLFSLEGSEEDTAEKRQAKAASLAGAVRSVTASLRETIWALNKEEVTLKDLSDRLKLYARNIFAYTEVKVRFDEDITKDKRLDPSTALNLYRISQEALNNSFKHAKATEVRISISDLEQIRISVSDNGVGFTDQAGKKETYGLANLKRRASEMGAQLKVDSEPGKGTTVTLGMNAL